MTATSSSSLDAIIRQFQLAGDDFTCEAYGTGHINDTFLVHDNQANPYLLQRINHQVYTDVGGTMDNISRVTEHLQHKLSRLDDPSLTTPRVIPTRDGSLFYQEASGNYWRILTFIGEGVAYEVVTAQAQAREAGRAFGQFQALLRDLPGKPLNETIPNFHHMQSRLTKFSQALAADIAQRAAGVAQEIDFVQQRADEMLDLHRRVECGQIPQRVTHNDTKLNNVLLDPHTHQARGVVDLDTVMPGSVLFDFGDAIRTTASTAAEDETDLDEVQLHLPYYEAFAQGYWAEACSFLIKEEIDYLPFSARYMTFIMGLRFLTDYLAGDVYYKIHHPDHNLRRARNQFQLVSRMEAQYDDMVRIIQQLL